MPSPVSTGLSALLALLTPLAVGQEVEPDPAAAREIAAAREFATDLDTTQAAARAVARLLTASLGAALLEGNLERLSRALSADFRGRFPAAGAGRQISSGAVRLELVEPAALPELERADWLAAAGAELAAWGSIERTRTELVGLQLEGEDGSALATARWTLAGTDAPRARATDTPSLDAALSDILAPLEDALLDRSEADHWLAAPAPPPRRADSSLAHLTDRLDALRARADVAQLAPAAADALAETIDALDRAIRFPEFRPHAEDLLHLHHLVLDAHQTFLDAHWLRDHAKKRLQDEVNQTLLRLNDPDRRPRGQADAAELDRLASLITDLDRLRADGLRVNNLIDAILSIRRAPLPSPAVRRDRLARARAVIDCILEARAFDPRSLPRNLRATAARLREAYRLSERALLSGLDDVLAHEGAITDPDLISLIADHRQRAEDLHRAARLPDEITALAEILPARARAAEDALLDSLRNLLDQTHRPDAIASLDRFDAELRRFHPIPFAGELRAATAPANIASAGRPAELLDLFLSARETWAESWIRATPDDHDANIARDTLRLAEAMATASAVLLTRGKADLLNRWALWQTSDGLLQRASSDIAARLKLASIAALDADHGALREQLAMIDRESAFNSLLGELLSRYEARLSALPGGAASILNQITHPPPEDAPLLDHREDFALLCWYALEADYARNMNLTDRDETLLPFLSHRAALLHNTIRESP